MDRVIEHRGTNIYPHAAIECPARWQVFGWLDPRYKEICYVDVQAEGRHGPIYPTTAPGDPHFETIRHMRNEGVEPLFVPLRREDSEERARASACQFAAILRRLGHPILNRVVPFGPPDQECARLIAVLVRTGLLKAPELDVLLAQR